MRNEKINNHILTSKVKRLITYVFLLSSVLINTTFLAVNYFYLSDYKDKQVKSWIDSFPRSIVTHLLEYNYQPINSKLEYVKNTELFSSFVVLNKKGKVISKFGQFKIVNLQSDNLTPIRDNFGNILGYYGFDQETKIFKRLVLNLILTNLIIIVLSLLIINILFSKALKFELSKFDSFIAAINFYVKSLKNLKDKDGRDRSLEKIILPVEITSEQILKKSVLDLVDVIDDLKRSEFESRVNLEKTIAKEEVAAQVAHDIRSPLAALNMVSKNLDELPETTRIMLRGSVNRIEDIANNLLQSSKGNKEEVSECIDTYFASPIIEEIVSEKRTQVRSLMNIDIQFNLKGAYGAFVKVSKSDLKRILSNLINNSMEAFGERSGKITLSLLIDKDIVTIKVSDNGMGIPKKIIEKLGHRGASFGKEKLKESGSGLGLYHARKMMEAWGGTFNIESELGRGTDILLCFNLAEAPSWFVPSISLERNTAVVIIDDDSSIHQIWDNRFKGVKLNTNLIHLGGPNDLKNWLKNNKKDKTLFLCDYEFIGETLNGLNLIEQNQISKKAILVTSRYEDEMILKRCAELGIKLLPKMLVEVIPFNIEADKKQVDVVHLDDDDLIRMCWDYSAKKANKEMMSFSNPDELKENLTEISKTTPFYIDSCLGDEVIKGQDLAKELYNLGYENLYMSTGFEKDKFANMPWIKDIIGKTPPWDNV